MLPNPITSILTKYSFIARIEARAPGEWKCYGSNDGSKFIEIVEASNMTRLTTIYYTIYKYLRKCFKSYNLQQIYWLYF